MQDCVHYNLPNGELEGAMADAKGQTLDKTCSL